MAKLVEAATKTANHRYSVSRGVYKLRLAICDWYKRRYGVELDPDSEAIVTIGSKEGIAHLALAILDQGDVVLAPTPTYPIHQYGCIIAGAQVQGVPMRRGEDFFDELMATVNRCWPRPKLLIMNFPHNPTTAIVDLRVHEAGGRVRARERHPGGRTISPTRTSASTATRRRR